MGKKVVQFRLTDANAKRLLAQIAANSGQVIFLPHATKQMRKRRISPAQVLSCLKKGQISESPFLDHYGNWKVTVQRYACGEHIGCSVAIDMTAPKAIIITAFWVN